MFKGHWSFQGAKSSLETHILSKKRKSFCQKGTTTYNQTSFGIKVFHSIFCNKYGHKEKDKECEYHNHIDNSIFYTMVFLKVKVQDCQQQMTPSMYPKHLHLKMLFSC